MDLNQILPVEASMDGNRHNFPVFLSGAIVLQVALLTVMSVLSYLSYGGDIAQIVTMNIQAGSGFGVAVNVCLTVGVLFTFPLMMHPVIHLAESALLGDG